MIRVMNTPPKILAINDARNLALRRLGSREYSSAEMVRYLRKKGADERVAAEVVQGLVESRLISDERYAQMMTRYQSGRGKGPAYIRMKLRQKGINAEMSAVKGMVGETTGETELDLAKRVVESRYPRALSDKDEAARAYQALVRRGFSFEVARAAVDKRSHVAED